MKTTADSDLKILQHFPNYIKNIYKKFIHKNFIIIKYLLTGIAKGMFLDLMTHL